MTLKLFDGGDSSSDEKDKIEINEEFARRYEHNKKREDLQRLEELKKKGIVDDSASEESSEDSEEEDVFYDLVNSSKHDSKLFDALIKIRKNDPTLVNNDVKLFESENEEDEEEEDEEEEVRNGSKKPMYLKDVVAKHLIEEGPEFVEKDVKSYSEEQEELRRAFLDAADAATDAGEEGDLLKEKKYDKAEENNDSVLDEKLDTYFGDEEMLDENNRFLKNYFRNSLWIDKGKDKKPLLDDFATFSEDEEELERQDEYECRYNFRHEEGGSDRVLGHARFIEGSVRKKTNARKLQRKSKEERMALAELERKEELKHLKNLKKKEIMEKCNKIREIAGISEDGVFALNEDDIEDDFDPEEHDRKMKEMFNDDYYGAEDVDPEFGSDHDEDGGDFEKPNFAKEDELLGLPKDWDLCGSNEGFLAAREKKLKRMSNGEGTDDPEKDVGKGKKRQKISLEEKATLEKEWDEYHKLDYEDTIGDLKTRFKYAKVNRKRYGLTAEEILMIDDKELNQYVSLKKLAPYREKEWKVPSMKRYELKKRSKMLHQGENFSNINMEKKKSSSSDGQRSLLAMVAKEKGQVQLEKSNGDSGNISRRSKKRRRQAELKLSHSRLMAYGKIPRNPKSKTK